MKGKNNFFHGLYIQVGGHIGNANTTCPILLSDPLCHDLTVPKFFLFKRQRSYVGKK